MIREVQMGDAKTINKLNEELGYNRPIEETSKQLESLMKQPEMYVIYVYEEDTTKEVLGYVHAQKYETLLSPPLLNILALAVSSKAQKQGIGRQLMKGIEKQAKERGYYGVRLNSGEQRKGAHQFYTRIGYYSQRWQKRFFKEL